VQGVAFDSGVVARAAGLPSTEVEERLDRLQRVHSLVRLVEERELAGREPSLRYAFVHILYQNALHESLRATRRAALSGAVAAALEACYGDQAAMASQLAVLYEAARDFPRAARQFLIAARNAGSVQAHKEAVALARRGLDAVRAQDTTPESQRLELQLQLSLGVPLTSLQGYASPEVEAAYSRARDLCAVLGETPSLIPALHGLYRFYIVRGRLRQSCDIVRQIISLAEGTKDPAQVIVARMALGAPLVHLGEFEEAADHLTADLALSEQSRSLGDALQAGADPGMTARLWLTLALWLLGRPSEALARNREALDIAERNQAPFGVAYAQCLSAWFHQYRGDAVLTSQHAEHAIRVAREHDFAQWLALGTMYRGWALVALGDVATGMALLTGGLAGFRRTGAELNLPHFLSLLADAHLRSGSAEEGLAAIDQAIAVAEANDDHCWEPELHRLRGELLLKQGGGPAGPQGAAAEACFHRAVEVAARYKSRSLDLRAVVSLGRLLVAQGRASEVAGAVTPVVDMLAAQPTAELEEARALLAAAGGQTAR
jgi:adenylate cyclase